MVFGDDDASRQDVDVRERLLCEAMALLKPLEWLADDGRECLWCQATVHTFNKREDIGTSREQKARDNHREDCRWLGFIKAVEAL